MITASLQRVINRCIENHFLNDVEPLVVDNIAGPKTKAAADELNKADSPDTHALTLLSHMPSPLWVDSVAPITPQTLFSIYSVLTPCAFGRYLGRFMPIEQGAIPIVAIAQMLPNGARISGPGGRCNGGEKEGLEDGRYVGQMLTIGAGTPSPKRVYIDIEGKPYPPPSLEYLTGFATAIRQQNHVPCLYLPNREVHAQHWFAVDRLPEGLYEDQWIAWYAMQPDTVFGNTEFAHYYAQEVIDKGRELLEKYPNANHIQIMGNVVPHHFDHTALFDVTVMREGFAFKREELF